MVEDSLPKKTITIRIGGKLVCEGSERDAIQSATAPTAAEVACRESLKYSAAEVARRESLKYSAAELNRHEFLNGVAGRDITKGIFGIGGSSMAEGFLHEEKRRQKETEALIKGSMASLLPAQAVHAAEFTAKPLSAFGGFDAASEHKRQMDQLTNPFQVGTYEPAKIWEEQRLESLAGLDKYLSAADKQLSMLASNSAAEFVAKHFGVCSGFDAALEQSRQMERIAKAAAFDPWKETLAKALFRDDHSLEVMNRALEPLQNRAFAAVGGEAASIMAAGALSVMSDLKSQIDKLTAATPYSVFLKYDANLSVMQDYGITIRDYLRQHGEYLPTPYTGQGIGGSDILETAELRRGLKRAHSRISSLEAKDRASQVKIKRAHSKISILEVKDRASRAEIKRAHSEISSLKAKVKERPSRAEINDLKKRLRFVESIIADNQLYATRCNNAANDKAEVEALPFSIVEPERQDDWYAAIKAAATSFHLEHKRMPVETELWTRLCKAPPHGYDITPEKNRHGECCLTMSGSEKALTRRNFGDRWKRYKPQDTQ